ncbi:hypothetical protein LRD69_11485 [Streptomyces sp. JH14]|uniref:hypothetical protein n=1 Tax=Streptomyces sp. JH14 TaxID=2793630 RepID=UPI0023F8BB02|nr:hypothetical protein [Streptomyces sp. JH14]MDF6042769.1 hypothetical protein [Streptomyces sp. JH14]
MLGRSCEDAEITAVDDCSPGSCGATVDGSAARGSRVRAPRPPRDVGPGPHDAGTAQATGDRLILLDGDGTLDRSSPGRPGVVHCGDRETYEAARGTGALLTDHRRPRSARPRADFRVRFRPRDDGHAAPRVMRRGFLRDTTVQVPPASVANGRPAPKAPVPAPA